MSAAGDGRPEKEVGVRGSAENENRFNGSSSAEARSLMWYSRARSICNDDADVDSHVREEIRSVHLQQPIGVVVHGLAGTVLRLELGHERAERHRCPFVISALLCLAR